MLIRPVSKSNSLPLDRGGLGCGVKSVFGKYSKILFPLPLTPSRKGRGKILKNK
jgi:hypothetical protein